MATLQRTVVNSSVSKWKAVVSGVPQGVVLGWLLFTIFISNMGSGVECTLSKSADNTKLCGAVDTLEVRDAIRWDLDRSERWGSCASLMQVQQGQMQGPTLRSEHSQAPVWAGQRLD